MRVHMSYDWGNPGFKVPIIVSKEAGETVCRGVACSGGKDIDEMEQKREHLKGMFRPRRSKDPRPTKVAIAVRELKSVEV